MALAIPIESTPPPIDGQDKTAFDQALRNIPDPQTLFDLMQKWDGPYAGAKGTLEQHAKWRLIGRPGADWLVARTAEETDLEMFDRAASVLSELGESAIPAILRWLECDIGEEHRCALLQALAWMNQSQTTRFRDAIKTAVNAGERHPSADVREKADAVAEMLSQSQ